MDSKYNDHYYKYHKYKDKYLDLARLNKKNTQINKPLENDLDKIYEIADHIKILGMAEATHGQQQITKIRMKIFKNLVKKHNYTVFVLEDQYSCCEKINQYIKTGKGNPRKLLLELMWFWWSFDMLFLIRWMRKYNLKHNNVLDFKGIDIQYICHDYRNRKDTIAKFVHKQDNTNKTVDQDDWVEADGFRDQSMFRVFMQFYDPSKKYFVYAHNYHISKTDLVGEDNNLPGTNFEGRYFRDGDHVKWFGNYLSEKFGPDYFSIGNDFKSGSYLETNDLVEQQEEAGLHTSYRNVKNTNTFISVKEVPIVGKINPDKFQEGFTILKNKNAPFDAIFIIEKEKPIKLFHYY